MTSFRETHFTFPRQTGFRRGKVRDIYTINELYEVLITTDRISAFDTILNETIPYKGQVLNQISDYMFDLVKDICPSAKITTPDPNVMIMHKAKPFPVEVIIRRCLVGYAWRLYRSGGRVIADVQLPEKLVENDRLPQPILTPTTKSVIGQDIEVSEKEIVQSGLVPADAWQKIRQYAFAIFERAEQKALEGNMLLCDAKYEFGWLEGEVVLIDELHTPDSARYLEWRGYEERQKRLDPQIHLTKEYIREWLMRQGFNGQPHATPPPLPVEIIREARDRYIEVYQRLIGKPFYPRDYQTIQQDIQSRTEAAIASLP
ncbi:MAG: phosphoribosylaminoimidazolesuccinocarboxamide synthase [Bacteroidia bacterium]